MAFEAFTVSLSVLSATILGGVWSGNNARFVTTCELLASSPRIFNPNRYYPNRDFAKAASVAKFLRGVVSPEDSIPEKIIEGRRY